MSRLKLGKTDDGTMVTLSPKERSTHMQVVGGSDSGKSKLFERMIRQDILARDKPGLCLIDPHGTLYNNLLRWIASDSSIRRNRNIHLFEPSNGNWCVGFNLLRMDGGDPNARADGIVNVFSQAWGGEDTSQKPRLERGLKSVLLPLIENEQTLLEAEQLTSADDSSGIRSLLTADIRHPQCRKAWQDFNTLKPHEFIGHFESTNNRLSRFLGSQNIRNTVGQINGIDFRPCMDNGDIVLVNLATTPTFSLENAKLLGTLITNNLFSTALQRDEKIAEKHPFYLYIDECHRYLNGDVEGMLDQTRKFGLHVILAHQRLGQLKDAGEGVYNAVMGGAHNKVVFGGLQTQDAAELANEIFLGELDLDESVKPLERQTPTGEFVREKLYGETVSETESKSSGGATTESDTSVAETKSHQQGSSTTHSRSAQETLRPVYEIKPTSVKSLDRVLHESAAKLKKQTQRHATVKIPGKRPCRIIVPIVQEGFASDERVAEVKEKLLIQSPYAKLREDVEQELKIRYEELQLKAQKFLQRPTEKAKHEFRPPISKKKV